MSMESENGGGDGDRGTASPGSGPDGAGQEEFRSNKFYIYRVHRDHLGPTFAYFKKGDPEVPYSELEAKLGDLYEYAKGREPQGESVSELTWRRQAYLVFFFEDEKRKMEGVTFTRLNCDGSDDLEPGGATPFVGGKLVDSAGSDGFSAFYCGNNMTGRDGNVLEKNALEFFKVKILHPPRAAGGPRAHEDAGTNLGPPKT